MEHILSKYYFYMEHICPAFYGIRCCGLNLRRSLRECLSPESLGLASVAIVINDDFSSFSVAEFNAYLWSIGNIVMTRLLTFTRQPNCRGPRML